VLVLWFFAIDSEKRKIVNTELFLNSFLENGTDSQGVIFFANAVFHCDVVLASHV
jgi:hypothetical protein